MSMVGDAWGTREEMLHPRDSHGRFRGKWKMAVGVVDKLMKMLGSFNPKTFGNDQEAGNYVQSLGRSARPGAGSNAALSKFLRGTQTVQAALRRGDTSSPEVRGMDNAMAPLPDDLILSRVVGPEAFGLTPETIGQIEEYTGHLVADKGYAPTNIGTPLPHAGPAITITIATPAGTRAAIPQATSGHREVILDRDQPLRITKVDPDGKGGFYVLAVATEKGGVGQKRPGKLGGKPPTPEPGLPEPGQPPNAPATPGAPVAPGTPAPVVPDANAPAVAPLVPQKKIGRPAGPAPAPRSDGHVAEAIGGKPVPQTPQTQEGVPEVAPEPVPQQPGLPKTPPPDARSTFRGAFKKADLTSPSEGKRRQQFNDAYLGAATGKKTPQEAVDGLEHHIALNEKILAGDKEDGTDSGPLPDDIKKQKALAQLIKDHFGLEGATQKEDKAARKAAPAAKKATPEAPKKESMAQALTRLNAEEGAKVAKADAGIARAEREHKASIRKEMRAKSPRPIPKPTVPKKTGPTPEEEARDRAARTVSDKWLNAAGVKESDLDDLEKIGLRVIAGDVAAKRISNAEGLRRLRDSKKDNLATIGAKAPAKRVAAPKKAVEPLKDDLSNATIAQLRTEAELRGIEIPSSARRKEDIRKAVLEGKRSDKRTLLEKVQQARFRGEAEDILDAEPRSQSQLRQVARQLGLPASGDDSPEDLRKRILDSKGKVLADAGPNPDIPKKATPSAPSLKRETFKGHGYPSSEVMYYGHFDKAKAEGVPVTVKKEQHGGYEFIGRDGKRVDSVSSPSKFWIGPVASAKKTEVPEAPKAPTPTVPEKAAGTAKGKLTASRVAPGTRILVRKDAKGEWAPTSTKTGATPITVTSKDASTAGGRRGSMRRSGSAGWVITGKDDDGNQITVRPVGSSQTFWLHEKKEPKAPAAKKAVPNTPSSDADILRELRTNLMGEPTATQGRGTVPVTDLLENWAKDLETGKIQKADALDMLDRLGGVRFGASDRPEAKKISKLIGETIDAMGGHHRGAKKVARKKATGRKSLTPKAAEALQERMLTDKPWTDGQRKSLTRYASMEFDAINSKLRGTKPTEGMPDGTTLWSNLDDTITEVKGAMRPLPEDVRLHRRVGFEAFGVQDVDGLRALQGKTLQDKAFMSTTIASRADLDKAVAKGRPVVMDIDAPAGTLAAYIGKRGTWSRSNEMLLDAGTKYRIDDIIDEPDGTVTVKATVLPDSATTAKVVKPIGVPEDLQDALKSASIADLRTQAKAMDIKVPASARTKQQVLDHIVQTMANREIGRRQGVAEAAKPAKKTGPKMSTAPLMENKWGTTGGAVNFHEDGDIGLTINRLGEDKHLEVDGVPLADNLGMIATNGVRGSLTSQQVVDEIKDVASKLPEGSKARRLVDGLAKKLDAPARPPLDMPKGTPTALKHLMEDFSKIPLARRQDSSKPSEMDRLQALSEKLASGEIRQSQLLMEMRTRLHNNRHESQEGKFEIDRVVVKAMDALEKKIKNDREIRRPRPKGPMKGEAVLAAAPATLHRAPRGHYNDYDGESLDAPEGAGSVRALSEYEGVEYERTNNYLRELYRDQKTGELTPATEDFLSGVPERIAEIDKTMKVSRLTSDVEVHRGVKSGMQTFGRDVWTAGIIDWSTKDLDEQDRQFARWEAGERPDLTGLVFNDKGFVSTTADPKVADEFVKGQLGQSYGLEGEPVVMSILVPKGTGGVQLAEWGHAAEILLERGLSFEVVKDNGVDDKGYRRLVVRVVPK